MKRRMDWLVALCAVAAVLLTACGGATSTAQTGATDTPTVQSGPTATTGPSLPKISMGGTSFTGHPDVTVKAGDTVTFSDPSSGGGFHNLVTGTGGAFTAEPGAPSQFASSSGMAFSPGDSVDITFSTPGTYHITCTIHPTMQATVTVTS